MNTIEKLKEFKWINRRCLETMFTIPNGTLRPNSDRKIPEKYIALIEAEFNRFIASCDIIGIKAKIDIAIDKGEIKELDMSGKTALKELKKHEVVNPIEPVIIDSDEDDPEELVPIVLMNHKGSTAIRTPLLSDAIIKMDAFDFYLKQNIVVDEDGQSFAWDKAYENNAKTKRKYIVPISEQNLLF